MTLLIPNIRMESDDDFNIKNVENITITIHVVNGLNYNTLYLADEIICVTQCIISLITFNNNNGYL